MMQKGMAKDDLLQFSIYNEEDLSLMKSLPVVRLPCLKCVHENSRGKTLLVRSKNFYPDETIVKQRVLFL
jgi:hypothetical protein